MNKAINTEYVGKKRTEFDPDLHRLIPAKAFIRDRKRRPEESFMMYRKAMRNQAIAVKQLVRFGSIHAYVIINKKTLEVDTNVKWNPKPMPSLGRDRADSDTVN